MARQQGALRPDQYYSMPMEHLGMMSVLASCRARGLDVVSVNGIVEGHRSSLETFQRMRVLVSQKGEPPLVVGISCIYKFAEVQWLAAKIKETWTDTHVVVGNSFATLNSGLLLENCLDVDAVIVGDGEEAFPSYVEMLDRGDEAPANAGVARRERGGVRPVAPAVVELPGLPWPARDELPYVRRAGFAPAISMSRGCPYRCTFCGTGAATDLIGRDGYRLRPIEDAVDEIESLVKDFGVDFVSISDDLFLSKHPASQTRAHEFATLLLERALDVKFMIDARVDSTSDLALMKVLRRSGLVRIYMGIETGSYEQLVAYRKRHVRRDEDPARRLEELADVGIEVIPGTIMFHPTVTHTELRETVRLLAETGYGMTGKLTDRMVAYAGTPLYAEYAAKGLLDAEWPVGEWHFQDPGAASFYDDLSRYLAANPDVDFETASGYFLRRLDEWVPADLGLTAH